MNAADEELDSIMWNLFEVYEKDMRLREPIDPAGAVSAQDQFSEAGVLAIIESTSGLDEFRGDMEVRAKRQMPTNLQVSVNLNLQLPPGINLQQLPAQAQQLLQQLMQSVQQSALQQAQQAVQQALQSQAPLIGAEAAFRNGKWIRIT